jgi:hypothetical protein
LATTVGNASHSEKLTAAKKDEPRHGFGSH